MTVSFGSVSPSSGPALRSIPVTLGLGTDLLSTTKVEMWLTADGTGAAQPCSFTLVSDSTLQIMTIAARQPGGAVIRVTGNGTAQQGFTFTTPPPQISSVTPQTGNAGDTVTLAGAYLDTVTAVTIGGIPVAITSQSATSLSFVAPPNLAGVQPIAAVNVAGTAQAVFTYAGPPVPVPCSRRAWLTLGDLTMPLEDETRGYYLTQLDLGFPTPRDVMDDRPDMDGATDRTAFASSRVVSANVVALAAAGATIDEVASMFGPFMAANVRPTLHYVLDRPGASERTLVVRGSGYSWPLEGAKRREVQLQWVAADGAARDVTVRTATAWAGSSSIAGRTYPLTFPRVYPAGGGSPSIGVIVPGGDVVARPKFRIYGPITGPVLAIAAGGTTVVEALRFAASFTIAAGHYVDADSHRRTITDDTGASVYGQVLWGQSQWAALLPGTSYQMALTGGSTSGSTQAVATWQDGYLS